MSLAIEVPHTEKCAFCAYLAGSRPYTVLHRSESIALLVTREQRGVPHVLVTTVRHVETVLDLSDAEAAAVMLGVRSAARAIDRAYGRTGIAVWQNNGISAAQTIPHVHFHVAGTLDIGGTERGNVPELTLGETDFIASRLKPYLD